MEAAVCDLARSEGRELRAHVEEALADGEAEAGTTALLCDGGLSSHEAKNRRNVRERGFRFVVPY